MNGDEGPVRVSPALRCWFCDHGFVAREVLRDGILRSRSSQEGGPYRVFVCPACTRENVCEKTRKGRWFASPSSRITFLDYVLSQVLEARSPSARTLQATISWLRHNEERRRYFFEADGDHRYRHSSWLRRLWSAPREEAEGRPASTREDAGSRAGSRRHAGQEYAHVAMRRQRAPAPHEILGVSPRATSQEIREAFRRLALHYHPDKVTHLGEEFERMAHEKFLRLKDAYEKLMAREAGQSPGQGRNR